jgi:hypothetical protein
MEKAISELMAADNIAYGRFTRAYLHYLSNPELTDTHESRQLMVLSLAMPDEPVLRKCWRDWMLDHLAQGDALDNGPTGTLVRYGRRYLVIGADRGRTMSSEHRQSLVNDLTKMTLPA